MEGEEIYQILYFCPTQIFCIFRPYTWSHVKYPCSKESATQYIFTFTGLNSLAIKRNIQLIRCDFDTRLTLDTIILAA